MKIFRFLFILLVTLTLFNSCRKDSSDPSSADVKKAVVMDDLSVKSTFDWKTIIQYKFTLTSLSNNAVIFVTPSGSVNRKYFLTAGKPLTITLSVPAYETTIHLLFNGRDIEKVLNGSELSYTFNY